MGRREPPSKGGPPSKRFPPVQPAEPPTHLPSGGACLTGDAAVDVRIDLLKLNAAYQRIGETPEENLVLIESIIRRVGTKAWTVHAERGFESAWLFEEAQRQELLPPSVPRDMEAYSRLVRAYLNPIDEGFWRHILQRLAWNGNVVFEITGETGMAKSSVALAIMDKIKPLDPARLTDFLVFDLADLPAKLSAAKPGDTILIDEYLRQAGEGSRTLQELLQNLEDTIRATGINLLWLSPEKKDHSTSHAEVQIFAWNRQLGKVRALVWVKGKPLGHITLDWCPDQIWKTYSAWKDENKRRSKAGDFRDRTSTARKAMAIVNNDSFVRYLEIRGKPTKQMLEQAVELFATQQMTVHTQGNIAGFLHACGYGWDGIKHEFEKLFGCLPSKNMDRLAKLCYKE